MGRDQYFTGRRSERRRLCFHAQGDTWCCGGRTAARITRTGASEARALTPVEVVQLGLFWRRSRRKVRMAGEGALQSREPASSDAEAAASPHVPSFFARHAKRVKLSTVSHQPEETEVPGLTPDDAYDRLLKNQQELVGRVPLPEAEPAEDQLAVLQLRVIGRGGTPYADFAVHTPYGRRLQAALRARACLLQPDGIYKGVIVPDPPASACWRVAHSVRCVRSFQRRGTWPSQLWCRKCPAQVGGGRALGKGVHWSLRDVGEARVLGQRLGSQQAWPHASCGTWCGAITCAERNTAGWLCTPSAQALGLFL